MKLGDTVEFVAILPVGISGKCTGRIIKIFSPRSQEEGPSYLLTDVLEEVDGDLKEQGDYRIDTLPDGEFDNGTIVVRWY